MQRTMCKGKIHRATVTQANLNYMGSITIDLDLLLYGNEVLDEADSSGADLQADMEFALIQMNTEALRRVDDALVRLEAGEYGCCCDCAGEISESRLRALPFAVRCRNCEQRHEQGQDRERELEQRRTGSLFSQGSAGL